ncbi:hypothetical protein ACFLSQ_10575 [Bacteroidota bacterium]
MKNFIKITFLTITIIVFYSCNNSDEPLSSKSNKQTVYANYGECLENEMMIIEGENSVTKIEFSYLGKILNINHLNAGFNCCVDDIKIDVEFKSGQIIITETDINPACDCLCLYNIDYEIKNIPAGTYIIKINESVKPENDDPIIFEVELHEGVQGEESFVRSGYPWGI